MQRVWLTRLAGSILVLILIAPQLGSAQKSSDRVGTLYKWRDQNGVVHYSETVPQDQRYDTTELNKHGRVVRQHQHSMEERRQAAEKAKKEKEELAQQAERKRRDDALLRTYTDLREIDESRERNVAIPLQAIAGLKVRREKVQEALTQLTRQVDALEKQGQRAPENLLDDIDETKAKISRISADIHRHEEQITRIRAKFDEDKRRFIELRGEAVSAADKL